MLDFGCVDVGFWLCVRRTVVVSMLYFGCVDVGICSLDDGFRLDGCSILVVWTLYLCCMGVGFGLYGRWILVMCPLDFDYLDVAFWLVVWMLDFGYLNVGLLLG